jgi:hypothetical protein
VRLLLLLLLAAWFVSDAVLCSVLVGSAGKVLTKCWQSDHLGFRHTVYLLGMAMQLSIAPQLAASCAL